MVSWWFFWDRWRTSTINLHFGQGGSEGLQNIPSLFSLHPSWICETPPIWFGKPGSASRLRTLCGTNHSMQLGRRCGFHHFYERWTCTGAILFVGIWEEKGMAMMDWWMVFFLVMFFFFGGGLINARASGFGGKHVSWIILCRFR